MASGGLLKGGHADDRVGQVALNNGSAKLSPIQPRQTHQNNAHRSNNAFTTPAHTLSTPGSATPLNALLIQNFQSKKQQAPIGLSATSNNFGAGSNYLRSSRNNSMAATVAVPSTAHPSSLRQHARREQLAVLATDQDNNAQQQNFNNNNNNNSNSTKSSARSRAAVARQQNSDDSSDGESSQQLGDNTRLKRSETVDAAGINGNCGLRPSAAHPKRRQSAATHHHASEGCDEGGSDNFIESVEVISPPTPSAGLHRVSIGLLNNSSMSGASNLQQQQTRLPSRSNTQLTQLAPPVTSRTHVTIPNWAAGDDFPDTDWTNESVKRVERWLDSADPGARNGFGGDSTLLPVAAIPKKLQTKKT